jgi:hypothetical protein
MQRASTFGKDMSRMHNHGVLERHQLGRVLCGYCSHHGLLCGLLSRPRHVRTLKTHSNQPSGA